VVNDALGVVTGLRRECQAEGGEENEQASADLVMETSRRGNGRMAAALPDGSGIRRAQSDAVILVVTLDTMVGRSMAPPA
jgi:hypothetical protein